MNRLASIIDRMRDSKVGLGTGFALAALAGAPLPLPQIALAGPIVAGYAAGTLGARAAAAVGFVSFVALNRPAAGVAIAAAVVAALVGWAVPFLMERVGEVEGASKAASAIVVDCDGFASLDEGYGAGTSGHVFDLLRRALETETRDSDLVVHSQGKELILVLDGSNPAATEAVMARVERRFAAWLSDAGYDCDLTVGLSTAGTRDDPLRTARRSHGDFYLD